MPIGTLMDNVGDVLPDATEPIKRRASEGGGPGSFLANSSINAGAIGLVGYLNSKKKNKVDEKPKGFLDSVKSFFGKKPPAPETKIRIPSIAKKVAPFALAGGVITGVADSLQSDRPNSLASAALSSATALGSMALYDRGTAAASRIIRGKMTTGKAIAHTLNTKGLVKTTKNILKAPFSRKAKLSTRIFGGLGIIGAAAPFISYLADKASGKNDMYYR